MSSPQASVDLPSGEVGSSTDGVPIANGDAAATEEKKDDDGEEKIIPKKSSNLDAEGEKASDAVPSSLKKSDGTQEEVFVTKVVPNSNPNEENKQKKCRFTEKHSSSVSWEPTTRYEYRSSPVPIVSLSHGLNRKASPSLQSCVALSLTLDGRDKITKVVQYAARFLAWWFSGDKLTAAHALRFKALYTNVSKSRKAFRLGRSFVELEKLRQMGLVSVMLWHLRSALNNEDATAIEQPSVRDSPSAAPSKRPHLPRKASSNIGWGPSTEPSPSESSRSRGIYRSLSNIGYRMYRPMVSQLSVLGPSSEPTKAPAWKIVGTALKLLGLLGFWAGDNVSFLTSTGFLDDYSLDEPKRLERRKSIQDRAVQLAFRSYFLGAVAGLITNIKAYWSYRQNEVKSTQERLDRLCAQYDESEDDDGRLESARQAVKEAGEKQFVLFLAVVKSCCDTLVFSNNAGIDLHKKYRGKKMHEGFHCLCGLLSASTVLYNNFPNATT